MKTLERYNTVSAKVLKAALLLILVLVLVCDAGIVSYGASAPAKPTIKTLTSKSAGSFYIKSNTNTKATGYELWYSTSSSFKTKTVKFYKGATLDKTVSGLSSGKTYYVKIRAYKVVSGKKVKSSFTAYKSVKTLSAYAYTKHVKTKFYTKKSSSSSSIWVWYNSKVKVISASKSSSGTWYKVKFNSKNYFVWEGKNETKFKSSDALATNYEKYCETDLQKEVLKRAFYIKDNWTTAYDFDRTQKTADTLSKKNGKYYFHCSGFSTYVINNVMQKHVPPYYITSVIEDLRDTGVIYNEGVRGQFKPIKVCGSTIDKTKLQPGDILFFKMRSDKLDHVGLYIGNNHFIQSTQDLKGVYTNAGKDTDGGVCIAPLRDIYKEKFVCAYRYLPKAATTAAIDATVKTSTTVYSHKNTTSGTESGSISAGDTVRIIYIYKTTSGNENAYIKYGDGAKGYIYKYKEKLSF